MLERKVPIHAHHSVTLCRMHFIRPCLYFNTITCKSRGITHHIQEAPLPNILQLLAESGIELDLFLSRQVLPMGSRTAFLDLLEGQSILFFEASASFFLLHLALVLK